MGAAIICSLADIKKNPSEKGWVLCATDEIRTHDTRIFSPLLYRLSYSGNFLKEYIRLPDFCQ